MKFGLILAGVVKPHLWQGSSSCAVVLVDDDVLMRWKMGIPPPICYVFSSFHCYKLVWMNYNYLHLTDRELQLLRSVSQNYRLCFASVSRSYFFSWAHMSATQVMCGSTCELRVAYLWVHVECCRFVKLRAQAVVVPWQFDTSSCSFMKVTHKRMVFDWANPYVVCRSK